ncbi:uncharacterized protein VTP21DRAFT_1789 [Calcarisporiella thermophila]|uniref:uncharacterized protein n=1 Tax=Calcarisporiella thermophila TaxID=911321 RepID=UPI00374225C6
MPVTSNSVFARSEVLYSAQARIIREKRHRVRCSNRHRFHSHHNRRHDIRSKCKHRGKHKHRKHHKAKNGGKHKEHTHKGKQNEESFKIEKDDGDARSFGGKADGSTYEQELPTSGVPGSLGQTNESAGISSSSTTSMSDIVDNPPSTQPSTDLRRLPVITPTTSNSGDANNNIGQVGQYAVPTTKIDFPAQSRDAIPGLLTSNANSQLAASDTGMNAGKVAGVSIACVAGVALLAGLFLWRRTKNTVRRLQPTDIGRPVPMGNSGDASAIIHAYAPEQYQQLPNSPYARAPSFMYTPPVDIFQHKPYKLELNLPSNSPLIAATSSSTVGNLLLANDRIDTGPSTGASTQHSGKLRFKEPTVDRPISDGSEMRVSTCTSVSDPYRISSNLDGPVVSVTAPDGSVSRPLTERFEGEEDVVVVFPVPPHGYNK